MNSKLGAVLWSLPILAALTLPLWEPANPASARPALIVAILSAGFLMVAWLIVGSFMHRVSAREVPGALLFVVAVAIWTYAFAAAPAGRLALPWAGTAGCVVAIIGSLLTIRAQRQKATQSGAQQPAL